MAFSPILHQESEMEAELKLALEEACQEAGVTLSTAFYPGVVFLTGDPNAVPPYKLARWLASARNRTLSSRLSRNSAASKARALAVDGILSRQLESSECESPTGSETSVSASNSPSESGQETSLQDRLCKAAELDIYASSFSWE
eukprot:c35747_g1_i1 orf=91-522(+)